MFEPFETVKKLQHVGVACIYWLSPKNIDKYPNSSKVLIRAVFFHTGNGFFLN